MKIAFIGFGEAARAFRESLAVEAPGLRFAAYDILLDSEGQDGACARAMREHGVEIAPPPPRHVTDPRKLGLLMAVISLAIACAQLAARKIQGRMGIKRASHGYRRKSTFRTGFDALRAWIQTQSEHLRRLCRIADNALKSGRFV